MDTIYTWVIEYGHLWVTQYGYIGIFILLFVGVFGLPIPDEILLAFAGYLIYKSDLLFVPTMASAFLGAVGGITLSYGLGHTAGIYLIERHGARVNLTAAKMDRVHRWFERMGRWALMFGYFFPGIRHLTALVAGSSKLEYPVFAVFAYIGAFLWTGAYIFLGYVLGEQWASVSEQVHNQLLLAVSILLTGVILYYIFWQRKQRRV